MIRLYSYFFLWDLKKSKHSSNFLIRLNFFEYSTTFYLIRPRSTDFWLGFIHDGTAPSEFGMSLTKTATLFSTFWFSKFSLVRKFKFAAKGRSGTTKKRTTNTGFGNFRQSLKNPCTPRPSIMRLFSGDSISCFGCVRRHKKLTRGWCCEPNESARLIGSCHFSAKGHAPRKEGAKTLRFWLSITRPSLQLAFELR